MNAPQVIIICLWVGSFFYHAAKDGKTRENGYDKYDCWHELMEVMVFAPLLWWGGFWK